MEAELQLPWYPGLLRHQTALGQRSLAHPLWACILTAHQVSMRLQLILGRVQWLTDELSQDILTWWLQAANVPCQLHINVMNHW